MKISVALAPLATCLLAGALCASEPPAGRHLLLPKIFDFGQYKRLFNKRYASELDELVRQRLYLGRVFRVFLSVVGYKHFRRDSYLSINQMSDWLPRELARVSIKAERLLGAGEQQPSDVPAASLEDIERQLRALLAQPGRSPALAVDILYELGGRAARRKRETTARDLSLEDVVRAPGVPDEAESSPRVRRRVASNNPDYERPKLSRAPAAAPAARPPGRSDVFAVSRVAGPEFLQSELKRAAGEQRRRARSSLPDELFIDHRRSGCFFKPRDQYECGCCYVFASVALYEWLYCMSTGNLVAFSEQYAVDCGPPRLRTKGCDGGSPEEMFKFVRHFGLELRADYRYRDRQEACPYDSSVPPGHMGYIRVDDQGVGTVPLERFERALELSPLLVGVGISDEFFAYGGGVDEAPNCDLDDLHAMLIVGSGRENGQEYWLMRNSHGRHYGEAGYYKLNKRSSQRCIAGPWAKVLLAPFRSTSLQGIVARNALHGGPLARGRQPHLAMLHYMY